MVTVRFKVEQASCSLSALAELLVQTKVASGVIVDNQFI